MWAIKLRGLVPICGTLQRCILNSSLRRVAVAANAFPRSWNEMYSNRQAIITLDRELRRFGRIRTDHFTNALNESVEQKFMTSQHAVLLLRSLGTALSDESPAVRVGLVKALWGQLESLGVKPDVSVYNALLQTYIENEYFVQPSYILEKMKTGNVTPNRVTYQRIVGLYCLQGDLNSASTVLSHMKSEGHPVNEAIFAYLIHGHIRAGDVAGAKSIFNTMRKAGIEPTAASFSMLMRGFAERGDIEAISGARKLAEDSNCLLLPRDFVPSIISLSKSGHSDKIPAVLDLITNHVGYNRDMMAAILQLCSLQKFNDAVSLFWTLRRPTPAAVAVSPIEGEPLEQIDLVAAQSTPMLFGRFLVRSLLKHKAPTDMVCATMQEMRERAVNSDTALDAARISAEYGRPEQFKEWLRRVKEEKLVSPTLRQHMFWPLFRMLGSTKEPSVDSVTSALREMKSMGVNFEHNSFVTLSEFLLPAYAHAVGGNENLVEASKNTQAGLLAKLERAGYRREQLAFSWLLYLLKQGLMSDAKDYLAKYPRMLVSAAYCSEHLGTQLRSSEDALPLVIEVISLIERNSNVLNRRNVELLTGRTLVDAIFARRTADWPEKVIDAFINAGLRPSAGSIRAARTELERRNTSKELLSRLDNISVARQQQPKMLRSQFGRRSTDRRQHEMFDGLVEMSPEQLELTLAKAREQQRPTLRVEKYLLMRYCQFGEVDKAEKLKAKLDARNFVYPPSMLRAMLTLAAAHKHSLDESLVIREKLKAAGGMPSPGAAIDIAAMQVRQGKMSIDDILASLRDYAEKQAHVLSRRQMGESVLLFRPASRLVQSLADVGQYKFAAKAMLTLIECGYISARCQILGDICVEAFIKAKDWDGLVDLVESMARKHKTVLAVNEVLSALIGAGDEHKPKVQRCIDAMSLCQGEMTTLNALLVSLVECGQMNEARKVLETPGLRALPRYLSWACESLTAKGKCEQVLSLVGVVRGLYNVDVEDMYFRLIKGYGRMAKAGQTVDGVPGWKKALEIYDRFEEESIQPRPRTLRYLADILLDHGQPVPFTVPSLRSKKGGQARQQSLTGGAAILKHVRRAVELLSRGQAEQVLAIRNQLDSEKAGQPAAVKGDAPVPLGTTFLRLLIQQLIDRHSHDLLVRLSSTLAASGYIDDLRLIRDVAGNATSQPLPDWCWEKLGVDLINTHVELGQVDRFVENVDTDRVAPSKLRRYLPPAALAVLCKSASPAAWGDIEKVVRKASSTLLSSTDIVPSVKADAMSLLNRFWTTCILSKDFERARRLEADFPLLLERPPLASILRQVKGLPLKKDALPIFDYFVSTFKSRPHHAAFVHSYALPTLAAAGEWKAVEERLQAMATDGIKAGTLRPYAITTVQALAKESGVELPSEMANLDVAANRGRREAGGQKSSN